MRWGRAWTYPPGSGRSSLSARHAVYSGASPGQGRHCRSRDKELHLLSSFPFSSMMCQLSVVESKSATFPSEKARHLLDDSVLESRSPRRGLAPTSSSAITNGLSLGKRLWPAHTSGRPRPGVCSCLSVTAQRPVAPQPHRKGSLQSHQSQGHHEVPWVCPHPAGGPEYGKQVEGAARHILETRRHCLATVKAGPGPRLGCCPPWSHRPQQAGQSWESCLRTATDGLPGARMCACPHTRKSELGGVRK